MNNIVTKPEEPDTLSGVFDDVMEGLQEALEWAKGEQQLRTIMRSTDDEFYRKEEEELPLNGHAPATKQQDKVTTDA